MFFFCTRVNETITETVGEDLNNQKKITTVESNVTTNQDM